MWLVYRLCVLLALMALKNVLLAKLMVVRLAPLDTIVLQEPLISNSLLVLWVPTALTVSTQSAQQALQVILYMVLDSMTVRLAHRARLAALALQLQQLVIRVITVPLVLHHLVTNALLVLLEAT